MKMTYHIIQADTIQKLEQQTTAALAAGAKLCGGVSVVVAVTHANPPSFTTTSSRTFYQAYTIEEDGPEEAKAALVPKQQETAPESVNNFWHGADCDEKTGEIHVYHFSDCAGGEKCEMFKYLNEPGVAEKHMKRGYEYDVIKEDNGEGNFIFKGRKLSNE